MATTRSQHSPSTARRRTQIAAACLIAAVIAAAAPAFAAEPAETNETLADAWRGVDGAAPARPGQVRGRSTVMMTCACGAEAKPARWNHPVAWDLSARPGVRFDLYCPDPTAIKQFVVYLGGDKGAYMKTAPAPRRPGWTTIAMTRSEAVAEGAPPAWSAIRTFAVAATPAAGKKAVFHLADLTVIEPDPMISLTRLVGHDSVDLKRNGLVRGSLSTQTFKLSTRFGTVTFPAERVVGLTTAGQVGANAKVLLNDGQIVTGSLVDPDITLKTTIGETMTVSIRQVRQCVYRISSDKPDWRPPTDPMMVIGDSRIAFAAAPETIFTLSTPHGEIQAAPSALVAIEALESPAGACRMTFRNGTTLIGSLGPASIDVELMLDPAAGRKAMIHTSQVRRIRWPNDPPPPADGYATAYLRDGQKVVGRLAAANLTVKTDFGARPVNIADITAVTLDEIDTGRVRVDLWNNMAVAGRLLDKTIAFTMLGDSTTLQLQASAVRSIHNAGALPAETFAVKIERLIRKLDSDKAAERDAAAKELIRSGAAAEPLLNKHLGDANPVIRRQLREILAAIGS